MRKVTFEQNEMLVMAMFDAGNRKHTLERIEEVIPNVQDDEREREKQRESERDRGRER